MLALPMEADGKRSAEALIAALDPDTDLARLVKRVYVENKPWVVVSSASLTGWQRRDPEGWARVAEWLASRHVTIVGPTRAATTRPVMDIVTDRLARDTREQLRAEIVDLLHLFEHAAVDLVGASEIADDVKRLGPRYRPHGRAIQSALGRNDLGTVVSEFRAVLARLTEAVE